jgi:hypothetical protein
VPPTAGGTARSRLDFYWQEPVKLRIWLSNSIVAETSAFPAWL